MLFIKHTFFIMLSSSIIIIKIRTCDVGFDFSHLNENDLSLIKLNNGFFSKLFKDLIHDKEKVRIDLYYEVFCPHCINFDKNQFGPLVENMSDYLNIHTFPYGNAKTIEENGKIHFICQHGPPECYGNKLHACALDILQHFEALLYNICLMNSTEGQGTDDKRADECGEVMDIDSKPIKVCAKGERGTELLKYYGEESKKVNFHHVPYVLIDGKKFNNGDNFKKAVCAAFENPPPPCTN